MKLFENSLDASVAKEMSFQGSSERIEGKSRPPQSGWKIVPQSRTGCRVMCKYNSESHKMFEFAVSVQLSFVDRDY